MTGAVAHPSVPHDQAERMLLVDDDPRMLSSLCELLQDIDCQLVTANCGKDAIEQLKKYKFEVVVLDLRLPDIDGHAIMDFILGNGIDSTVIVQSGNSGINSAIGALKRGAYAYLRKPYQTEELISAVTNALQKRRLEAINRNISWRLECSEKLYRYLVDSSPDLIYTLDAEGRFTFINETGQQLLGYAREELIGQHFSFLIHEEDKDRAHFVFNERRVGERASRNVELRLKCRDTDMQERVFDTRLMNIAFSSMGMYALSSKLKAPEFFGTYGVARDITERKRAEAQISYQAYHDILTDLPNRILFRDRLELALIQAKRNKSELAVMFVDLDRFKIVNDSLGHIKGDELLQQVATRLKENLRRGDTLARFGGDEFTLLLPDLRTREDAAAIAGKFVESMQGAFALSEHQVHVSASIGIAVYPDHGETIDDLLRHADMAMYQVKGTGKNGFSFYDQSMTDASFQKVDLENNLRRALDKGELEMYYQPQVDIRSGKIVGAEALMRWNHPQRGLLSAAEFLPFAEESGLILPVSDWMIRAVCQDILAWETAGAEPIKISVNLSPQYLDRGDFYKKLKETLLLYKVAATQIEVEITENVCIRNPQHAIEQLNQLCELGVSVAIDDFGTGYSSLAYLHRFPVKTIKIDQSFVKEIRSDKGQHPVVLAVISIARGLGLHLVAEGVETQLQAHYLERAGCAIMQGHLFHRALTRDQLTQHLETSPSNLLSRAI
ncbi:MAG: EAL domain-containing protein [Burkholderiaceae bacterium]|nr:EAL domain-containing protein [Burkholderiaceae bacterium]